MSSTSTTTTTSNPTTATDVEEVVNGFVQDLSDRISLERQVHTFCIQHASHHRPIVLVTSGGTVVDLERHSVRSIENFSTGTRGASSVECFLRRGYAVIHLWRKGSSSPYGRILSETIGLHGQEGISMASIGKLFVGAGDQDIDEEDQMVQSVLNQDPWMTDSPSMTTTNNKAATTNRTKTNGKKNKMSSNNNNNTNNNNTMTLSLHHRVEGSSRLQMALRERQQVLQEGRLITIPFRSVEEYLAKLQICSLALKDSQALGMVYLAAAVSDFYIPQSSRPEHKIQSGGGDSHGGALTLILEPVPKVMGLLRSQWAPDAFVCSFKLETDPTLLRQKAERAVTMYGCHMVVGNLLETRYSEVSILAPSFLSSSSSSSFMDETKDHEDGYRTTPQPHQWPMHTIRKSSSDHPDSLEEQLVDVVIQGHFEYVSHSCQGTFDKAGIDAILLAHEEREEKKKQWEREIFWEKVQQTGLEWMGVVLGALLSYGISAALKRRMGA